MLSHWRLQTRFNWCGAVVDRQINDSQSANESRVLCCGALAAGRRGSSPRWSNPWRRRMEHIWLENFRSWNVTRPLSSTKLNAVLNNFQMNKLLTWVSESLYGCWCGLMVALPEPSTERPTDRNGRLTRTLRKAFNAKLNNDLRMHRICRTWEEIQMLLLVMMCLPWRFRSIYVFIIALQTPSQIMDGCGNSAASMILS